MIYTQRTIHSGFIGFLLLLMTVLLFFFHTRPNRLQLLQLQKNAANLQTEANQLSGKSTGSTLPKILSEVEQKQLQKALPESLAQDDLITDLQRISKVSDIIFNNVNFTLQPNTDIPTVNIAAGIQGTSAAVTRFLKMVETNPRKFVVKDASVSRAEDRGGFQLVNLQITLQSYYRKQK